MSDKLNQEVIVNMDDDDTEVASHEPLIKVAISDDTNIEDESEALLVDTTPDDGGISEIEESTPVPGTCCYLPRLILSKINQFDQKLSSYIFKWSPGKFFDLLMAIPCLAFSYFGFPLWIVVYIFIMKSYLYGYCVLISIVVTQIMKRCFKRTRPNISELGQRWFYLSFEDVSAEHSFPSGDTSQSAVFGVTLGISVDYYYYFALFCVTPFGALGRIYFGR
eukprot:UN13783